MHRATTGSKLKYYYINIINIQHWISIKSIIIMNIYHLQALKMMTVNALMNGGKKHVLNEGRYNIWKLNNCQKDYFYYHILTLTQSWGVWEDGSCLLWAVKAGLLSSVGTHTTRGWSETSSGHSGRCCPWDHVWLPADRFYQVPLVLGVCQQTFPLEATQWSLCRTEQVCLSVCTSLSMLMTNKLLRYYWFCLII